MLGLAGTSNVRSCSSVAAPPSSVARSHSQAASTSEWSKYFTLALVNGLQTLAIHFSHLRSPTIAIRSKSE